MKKVILIICIVMLISIIVCGALIGIQFYDELYGNKEKTGIDVEITIPQGTTIKKIAGILKEKNIIKFERAFIERVKRLGLDGSFKYGTYTINTGIKKDDLIMMLTKEGRNDNIKKVLIPEGYSVEQIAEKLEQESLCTKEEFLIACNKSYDYEFLKEIPSNVNYRLQGFLFPSTYNFKIGATAEDIIITMLEQFKKEFKEEYKQELNSSDENIYKIITIASLIEREAKVDDERATISGVIYNRLKINMALQIDATVQYVVSNGLYNVSRILYKDLEVKSLYNTYKNKNLPIGPICNPGIESIKAALEPEQHEYLFYKVINSESGRHAFTKTYEEHESL